MEKNKPRSLSPSVKINLRMSTKAEVIRKLIAIGFEHTDYENMTDKFDCLRQEVKKISECLEQNFEKIFQVIDSVHQELIQSMSRNFKIGE
ncbi:MAG: hypothetical protein KJ737_04350 [Proteobacteria bacterium]|nr:hypothetical protein [Pseudomonadota bacterium]